TGSGKLPRLFPCNIIVCLTDQTPDIFQNNRKLKAQPGFLIMHGMIFFDTSALEIIRPVTGYRSNSAIKVFLGHGEKPAQQVSEVVCKIIIDATYQCIFRKISVKTKRHLSEKKVSEGINAVFSDQFIGIDHVAQGLGHLLSFDGPPAMGKNV